MSDDYDPDKTLEAYGYGKPGKGKTVTIVLLAIVLDRMSKAWAMKQPEHVEGATWLQRHRLLASWLGLVAVGFAAAWMHPYFAEVERKQAGCSNGSHPDKKQKTEAPFATHQRVLCTPRR